jgi:hypothetical protein
MKTIVGLTGAQLEVQRQLDEQCRGNAQRSVGMAPELGAPYGAAIGGANAVQYGGTHYKQLKFETWDVILDWKLGYLDGNAVKYLSRWRHKGGVEDLRKAKHYIEKLIEEETK